MMERYKVPDEDNDKPLHPPGTNAGRPGIGKDGEPGVRVQSIMPAELVKQLDEWATRNNIGRGPAVRKIVEAFIRLDGITQRYLEVIERKPVDAPYGFNYTGEAIKTFAVADENVRTGDLLVWTSTYFSEGIPIILLHGESPCGTVRIRRSNEIPKCVASRDAKAGEIIEVLTEWTEKI